MKDPVIDWEFSHLLTGDHIEESGEPIARAPFVPEANTSAFKRAASKHLTATELQSWNASVEAVDGLAAVAIYLASSTEEILQFLQEA